MKINKIILQTIKWVRYFTIAYMLGFANVLNQETKTMDDTFTKIEQTSEDQE
ncbi:hypothetical protein [Dyadobacter sp. LHD-138]|uniref:hypothetical protein n=1 Tax=Dyadobacter sp. LHD-138 TaxID=3071413 RepID=UPI0027DFE3C9|nr:hypothetical protein [Dyadobacter sp. LHD-138]MDQ6482423.1 hypothetical protein [Dyadobacter sp. LHD-138]